jgi:hypothetical protein
MLGFFVIVVMMQEPYDEIRYFTRGRFTVLAFGALACRTSIRKSKPVGHAAKRMPTSPLLGGHGAEVWSRRRALARSLPDNL